MSRILCGNKTVVRVCGKSTAAPSSETQEQIVGDEGKIQAKKSLISTWVFEDAAAPKFGKYDSVALIRYGNSLFRFFWVLR